MNAAARLVHQNTWSRHLLIAHLFTRRQVALLLIILTVLMSALGIIYVTHDTRVLHAQYQNNLTEQDRLLMQHGQLLLERSTWMLQSRIERIAESQLGMIIPDNKSVVIIRE